MSDTLSWTVSWAIALVLFAWQAPAVIWRWCFSRSDNKS